MTIHSQESYEKLPFTITHCPTIIINESIIANEKIIETKKEFILEMSVLKDKPDRKTDKFYNLTENGIIFITLEEKPTFKTQSELNEFLEIEKKNKVYVNGYLIESPDYKIATESIVEIELIEPKPKNQLKKKAVNVWTLTKKERINGCKNKSGKFNYNQKAPK